MKSIVVFCGSKSGTDKLYQTHARELGQLMAAQSIRLIYGGGNKGLMGTVADAVMAGGGAVTGIMPEHLAEWDHSHQAITELIIVPDMHVRKRRLYELCQAAVILPGGYGTLDEMFEFLTWNQLSIHDKPVFVLNTAGYYSYLLQMMEVMHTHGFLHGTLHERISIFTNPVQLLQHVASLAPVGST